MTIISIKAKCFKMIKDGTDIDEVIKFLYESKISITESIKMIRDGFGFSLKESKNKVCSHPSWKTVVEGNQKLHDELEDLITKSSET